MFFIFGSPRSGTTLLAQCLNAHSQVVVPQETDFIIPVAFVCDRVADPAIGRELVAATIVNGRAFARSIGKFLSPEDVRACVTSCDYTVAAILDALYSRVASHANRRLAGDKSPNDLLFLRILMKTQAISAGMPIIHIVRDVRDVCASIHERGWIEDMDLYFPRFWSSANLYLHRLYAPHTGQYLLVRYEDLVAEPGRELTRVFAHLGLAFEPEVLQPSNRDDSLRKVAAHANLFQPIGPQKIGRYREDLTPAQIAEFERQANEGLRAFGYL